MNFREKMKGALTSNKIVIIAQINVVLLPLYLGLIISNYLGSDIISLGGDLVILGGLIAYLSLLVSLIFLWMSCWLREATWKDLGLSTPRNWLFTIVKALGISLVIFGIVALIINPILNVISSLEPRDMSIFEHLTRNLPNLIINIIFMLITAGILEELLWRGYLLNRLMDVQGKDTKIAWVIVLFISALIFGLAHAYQGTYGMIKTGLIGFIFSVAYLVSGKNLWPLILSHMLIDSLDFISHYSGN